MSLIDESPGGLIVVANAVLYGTVGIEIWMLTTNSLLAMGAVMALIITISAFLCRWMMRLMGPEDVFDYEPERAVVQRAVPAPATTRSAPPTAARPILH